MARLFSNTYDSLKVRKDIEETWKKKVFIAYEGVVTEPFYFDALQKFTKGQKGTTVEIYPVNREKTDGKSAPKNVRDGLSEY